MTAKIGCITAMYVDKTLGIKGRENQPKDVCLFTNMSTTLLRFQVLLCAVFELKKIFVRQFENLETHTTNLSLLPVIR